jgi:hypothetical protein
MYPPNPYLSHSNSKWYALMKNWKTLVFKVTLLVMIAIVVFTA